MRMGGVAGQSKKVTTLTLMFVAYATAACIGPQVSHTPF